MIKVRINGLEIYIEQFFISVLILCVISENFFKLLFYFLACYLFVTFHEISHIFLAQVFGSKISKISFTLCGTYATLNLEKLNNIKKIFIYLIGPLSNLFLAVIFRQNNFIFSANILLCTINLIPIYPLDGYNILKNIIEMFCMEYKKEKVIIDIIKYLSIISLCIISVYEMFFNSNYQIIVYLCYIYLINIMSK